jgi:hypothetical protein
MWFQFHLPILLSPLECVTLQLSVEPLFPGIFEEMYYKLAGLAQHGKQLNALS